MPFINVAFFSHTSSCGVLLRIVERMSESVTTAASSRQERLSEYCEDRERGRCVAEAELRPWVPWASRLLLHTPYIQVSRLLVLSIQCAFALVRSPYTLVDWIRLSPSFAFRVPLHLRAPLACSYTRRLTSPLPQFVLHPRAYSVRLCPP